MRPIAVALVSSMVVFAGAEAGPADGERVFQYCYSCHSVIPGETEGLQGPNLAGIVGHRIAAQPGFDYSQALRALAAEHGVWTRELLARFIEIPEAIAPGTTMNWPGLASARERAVLIDYLATTER